MQSASEYISFIERLLSTARCWQEYCKRTDSLQNLEMANDLRPFRISDEIYEAVAKGHFTNLGIFEKLGDANYCATIRTLSEIGQAYEAVDMRRFDMLDHTLRVVEKNLDQLAGVSCLEFQLEGTSKITAPVAAKDIIIIRSKHDNWYTIAEICLVRDKTVQFRVSGPRTQGRLIKEKRFEIMFVKYDDIYNHRDRAIEMIAANATLRRRLVERGSRVGPAPSPKIDIKQRTDANLDRVLAKLSKDQQLAVVGILAAQCNPMPYIVAGPAGTGKTRVLLEAVAQICGRNPRYKTLITTNSSACADRISDQLNTVYKLDALRYRSDEKFQDIYMAKTIVTTNTEAAHLTNVRYFDYVLIDDAYTVSELDTLMPICLLEDDGCLVLAGDPEQFESVSKFEFVAKIKLDRSLLARVAEFAVYSEKSQTHPRHDSTYITKLFDCYRCVADIMKTPNELFYDKRTRCVRASSPELLAKLNIGAPVQFHHVEGHESNPLDLDQWVNELEAGACVKLVIKYVELGQRASQIGVITPCEAQARLIAKQLGECASSHERYSTSSSHTGTAEARDSQAAYWAKIGTVSECKVGTVEAFQGDERDMIIISNVRTTSPCCWNTPVERKRFNVAITRARLVLIVAGDWNALKECQYWREFFEITELQS